VNYFCKIELVEMMSVSISIRVLHSRF